MDLPTNRVKILDCNQGAVRAIRFNVDGNYCLTCGSDKSLKLWNPHSGSLIQTYSGHGFEVLDARGSCDNAQLVSCGLDKTAILWDVSTAAPIRKFRGHAARVNSVCFNEESTVVLTASLDCTVKVWDCRSKSKDPIQPVPSLRSKTQRISARPYSQRAVLKFASYTGASTIAGRFTPGTFTNQIQAAFREPRLFVSDPKSDHQPFDRGFVRQNPGLLHSVTPIRRFDSSTVPFRAITRTMDEAKDSISTLDVSDHEILTGSLDCFVRRYDLRIGQMSADAVGKSVSRVSFTKDGQCILISCLDSTVKLLDKSTGELLGEYVGHKNTDFIIDSCLNNTDTHVLSGSEDGNVYIWDLIQSKVTNKLDHPASTAVHSLSFHPTQPCLLTATGGAAYFWKTKE